jgi:aspartyl-tRNA(Asn)/glutamyl-tRNA(Gln) amidotransferase subunit A
LVLPEAAAIHRELIRRKQAGYDPRVASRILRGATVLAADYIAAQEERAAMIIENARVAAPFDALLMPTVAMLAPAIAPLEADEHLYNRIDYEILRNPSVVNFIDGCALTVPCHEPGSGPVGLMIVGQAGEDRRVFAVGLAIEAALRATSS